MDDDRRRPARRWAWAAVLAGAAACSTSGVNTAGGDAAMDRVEVAIDATDSVVDDRGDAGAPTDVPIADVGVDVNHGLSIPIDPMGVPAPGSECPGVHPGEPTIAPPRPIVPQSVSRVTSMRPTFRWALPAGTTGARVEVCADRCCTRVIQTLEAEGTSVRPTAALPPGVVYWRMFGRRAGVTGSRASYTWEFGVRRRDTPVDSSWGTIRDFTGDGYDDLVLFAAENARSALSEVFVVEGSAGGPRPPRSSGMFSMGSSPWTRVGDFNGDGRADIAYPEPSPQPPDTMTVLEGHEGGLRLQRSIDVSGVRFARFSTPAVTDWNGDGYSDLVVSIYFLTPFTVTGSVLVVYHGSRSGLGVHPQEVYRFESPVLRPWVESFLELRDLDLDGYGDIFVGDREYSRSGYGKHVVHYSGGDGLRLESIPDPPVGAGASVYSQPAIPDAFGDMNGDGRVDVALVPESSSVVLIYDGARGLASLPSAFVGPQGERGEIRNGGFGANTEGGDLNGDGFADLFVSAHSAYAETFEDTGLPSNRGRMYVCLGGEMGLGSSVVWFDRAAPAEPGDSPQGFAEYIASPGDMNGDGVDDAVIADPFRRQICFVGGAVSVVNRHLSECSPHPGQSIVLR